MMIVEFFYQDDEGAVLQLFSTDEVPRKGDVVVFNPVADEPRYSRALRVKRRRFEFGRGLEKVVVSLREVTPGEWL